MKKIWPVLFCLVISICLGHFARGGGWGSVGAPPPPPIPPRYDFKYTCFVELSDEKSHVEKDTSYYLVATARFDFEKNGGQSKTSFKGSDLDWKLQKFRFPSLKYDTDQAPGEMPYSYRNHQFYLVIDAKSSSQGESADQDVVILGTELAQNVGRDKLARYGGRTHNTRENELLKNEVRSRITNSKGENAGSLMIRVSCEKKL